MTTSLATIIGYMGEWAGAAELATLFGVSRQRVQQIVNHPTFPPAAIELAMGKIWRVADVKEWAASRGRELFQ